MTPTIGLIAGLILIVVAKLCYLWGFRDGRRATFKGSPLGKIMADPRVPRDTVLVVDEKGYLHGKIGNLGIQGVKA